MDPGGKAESAPLRPRKPTLIPFFPNYLFSISRQCQYSFHIRDINYLTKLLLFSEENLYKRIILQSEEVLYTVATAKLRSPPKTAPFFSWYRGAIWEWTTAKLRRDTGKTVWNFVSVFEISVISLI